VDFYGNPLQYTVYNPQEQQEYHSVIVANQYAEQYAYQNPQEIIEGLPIPENNLM